MIYSPLKLVIAEAQHFWKEEIHNEAAWLKVNNTSDPNQMAVINSHSAFTQILYQRWGEISQSNIQNNDEIDLWKVHITSEEAAYEIS